MKRRHHILIMRFSAFGDVAILAPIIKERMMFNSDVLFSVAAPAKLEPLFRDIPNLEFIPVNKKDGAWKIFRQLRKCRPTVVADVHSVIRTILIDMFFLLQGTPIHYIHKQHIKRALLIKKENKVLRQLSCSWQLYDYVLCKSGLQGRCIPFSYILPKISQDGIHRIGVAPFANFIGKSWPVENMKEVVSRLSDNPSNEIYLYGGKKELPTLEQWSKEFRNTICMAGTEDFSEELDTIRRLDVMVSMDSANMHFASCVDVPVVSIWGATHPYCGFYGWRQDPSLAVQADIKCRPCSIYGNAECYKGTYECMKAVTVEMVLERIERVVGGK